MPLPQRDQLKFDALFLQARGEERREEKKTRDIHELEQMIVMVVRRRGRAKFATSALLAFDWGSTQQTGMLSQCTTHNTWWMCTLCYISEKADSVQKHTRKSFLSSRVELKACHFNYPGNFLLNWTLYVDPLEGPPTQLAWFVGLFFFNAAVSIGWKVLKNLFRCA